MPQREFINNGAWRALDDHIADLARENRNVYVNVAVLPFFNGSLPTGLPIPIGFWKSVVYEQGGVWLKECYLISQFSEYDNEVGDRADKLRNLRCDDYLFQLLFGWRLFDPSNENPKHTQEFLEGIEADAKNYFLKIDSSNTIQYHFPTYEELISYDGSDKLLSTLRKLSRACSLEGLRPKRSDQVIPQLGLSAESLSIFDYEVWPLPYLPPPKNK